MLSLPGYSLSRPVEYIDAEYKGVWRRVHDGLMIDAMAGSDDDYPGLLPQPPGQKAYLLHPDSITDRLLLTCILGPAITVVFCLTRLYTTRFISRRMHPDDCECSLALPFDRNGVFISFLGMIAASFVT